MFQKTAEFLSDFEYSDSAYRILAPKKPDDLIEEGRQLSHCVKDAKSNHDILISAVDMKFEKCPHFLLAGHFCIVDKDNEVELLPEYVFSRLHLSQIILLEANVLRIAENINGRDHRKYPAQTLERLIACERSQAQRVAKELKIPLTIHNMQFNCSDEEALSQNPHRRREQNRYGNPRAGSDDRQHPGSACCCSRCAERSSNARRPRGPSFSSSNV